MSNPTAVSDLERSEHLNYADGKGVKRVTMYNNGVQANGATEETLQAVATSAKQDDAIDAITNKDIMITLKALILAIANPSYVDKSANAIRNQVQSGTITTVTTVTGVTNLGTWPGGQLAFTESQNTWANMCRSLIT